MLFNSYMKLQGEVIRISSGRRLALHKSVSPVSAGYFDRCRRLAGQIFEGEKIARENKVKQLILSVNSNTGRAISSSVTQAIWADQTGWEHKQEHGIEFKPGIFSTTIQNIFFSNKRALAVGQLVLSIGLGYQQNRLFSSAHTKKGRELSV